MQSAAQIAFILQIEISFVWSGVGMQESAACKSIPLQAEKLMK
jgi:hypothetical protein